MSELRKTFRGLMDKPGMIVVPGASSPLEVRLAEQAGFAAAYMSGYAAACVRWGVPDIGLVGYAELEETVRAIRMVTNIPLIVDCDTGFGNSLNVQHTVRVMERAGANCIQLEDQSMPKKCGHFAGKEVIGSEEAASKIKAAVDARKSEDFLILARTDARAMQGFNAAVDRAQMFIEAGADITFVEAPESIEEIRKIPELLKVPQLINIVIGGKTPTMELKELADLKFGVVLYANAALQGAIAGMQNALRDLKQKGRMDEGGGLVASFKERQRLVQKPEFDALEKKYAVK